MLVILCVLIGLAVSIDFHRELCEQIRSFLLTSVTFLKQLWQILISHISKGLDFLTNFFNEKVLPYFAN